MNGNPGQNPMQAFHHPVRQTVSIISSTSRSPL